MSFVSIIEVAMHFVFGILLFLFFWLRSWSRRHPDVRLPGELYDQAAVALSDLVAQYGGNYSPAGCRKLLYVSQDRTVELFLNADTRRLVLRLRKKLQTPFTFYRVPRLPYAFLDAFIQPALKIEGTHYLIGSRNTEMLAGLKNRNGFVPIFQKLDQAGFSGQTTSYGLKLWKTLSVGEVNDISFLTYIRLTQDLARLCDTEVITIPVQPLISDKRCAYCKELLEETEAAQYCQWCGTPHHRECFELNGRCTVYGCERPVSPVTTVNAGSV